MVIIKFQATIKLLPLSPGTGVAVTGQVTTGCLRSLEETEMLLDESMDREQVPTGTSLPGHTPSRRHAPKSPYHPEFPPYYSDWSYPNRQTAIPDFSCAPYYGSPSSAIDSQVESLLESQKEIIKVQHDLVSMVKDVFDRVGDLEETVSKSVSSGHEEKYRSSVP